MSLIIKAITKLFSKLSVEKQKNLIKELNKHLVPDNSNDTITVLELKKEYQKKEGIICPHCGSSEIVGYGKYRERNRYKCKKCFKTFNDLSGTPMSGTRMPDKWEKYINCMIEGLPLRKIAKELEFDLTTAFYWRHKILNAFRKINCVKLEGIIESDETFFLYSEKGKKEIRDRKPRKRGGKASKRGNSSEQVAVMTACDRQHGFIGEVSCLGRISSNNVKQILDGHIEPGSTLCTDENRSYRKFAEENKLNHERINISKGQKIKNKIYHIQNINGYHSRLKKWIERFHGVASKYLSNYLSWFRLLEKTKTSSKQLLELIKYSLQKDNYVTIPIITTGYTQFMQT